MVEGVCLVVQERQDAAVGWGNVGFRGRVAWGYGDLARGESLFFLGGVRFNRVDWSDETMQHWKRYYA